MNPCNCKNRGPVVTEEAENGGTRVVCCYCWRKTDPYESAGAAITAWNAGNIRAWNPDE